MKPRPSVCYVAPGHALLTTCGPTRNMLSLAGALSQWADVTVAFRSIREPIQPEGFKVIAIEPQATHAIEAKDDAAIRGRNPFPHVAYLGVLRSFARQWARSFDLVLEKGWRLSGFLTAAFRRQGVPAMLVENDVRYWSHPPGELHTRGKYLLHKAAQGLSGFYSRRAPLVIAETGELKTMLMTQRGLAPQCIEVIELGVDHALFRPQCQATSRQALGIQPNAVMLLYVGGMDAYHDLGPVIEALAQVNLPGLELHLVGDGTYRSRYENQAKRMSTPVRFHGQMPHHRVPEFIAAADLCLAPYQISAFHDGQVAFSTLKIPEYMACGRPVISVPSGHIQKLIEDRISGFLFPNDALSWRRFLKALPSRGRLEEMGQAATQAVAELSWDRTAERYLEASRRVVAGRTTT